MFGIIFYGLVFDRKPFFFISYSVLRKNKKMCFFFYTDSSGISSALENQAQRRKAKVQRIQKYSKTLFGACCYHQMERTSSEMCELHVGAVVLNLLWSYVFLLRTAVGAAMHGNILWRWWGSGGWVT